MIKDGENQQKIESMISSMTLEEKQKPEVLAAQPSRRQRIAQGSGYEAKDVDKVLADFQRMRGFMKQMSNGGMPEWVEYLEWEECMEWGGMHGMGECLEWVE